MAQIDLGLRLFLMDQASSGLMSFNSVLMGFGAMVTSGFSDASAAIANYSSDIAKAEEANIGLRNAMSDTSTAMVNLDVQYAAGAITQAEWSAGIAGGNRANQEMNDQIIANQAAIDGMTVAQANLNATLTQGIGVMVGAGIDLALFAGGLKTSVDNAGTLQDAMARVQIAVVGTDKRLGDMTNTLTTLADNSIYTSTQLAQGFELLGEKGYTASQIIDQKMGVALTNLSQALGAKDGSGVTGAANLLAAAMEVFQAKASDASHYADLLTFAFYNGIPSADGLRQALEMVGGRAQLLNIPLQDIVVLLDQLGRAGMTGSQAGAALNYALTNLSSPIPKAQSELAQLGILVVNNLSPAFDAFSDKLGHAAAVAGATPAAFDGSVKSLQAMFFQAQNLHLVSLDATFYQWAIQAGLLSNKVYDAKTHAFDAMNAFKMLADAISKLPKEDQLVAIQGIFNVRSGTGATQLIENLKKVEQKSADLVKSHQAQGLAEKDAAAITSTYNARLQELNTTLATLAARVGTPIVTSLAGIFKNINDMVGALDRVNPALIQFMDIFLVLGTVISVVAVIMGGFMIISLMTSVALAPIIITVLLVAAGIAVLSALIAGIVMVILHWGEVAHWLQGVWGTVSSAIGTFFSGLGTKVHGALDDTGNKIHSWAGNVGGWFHQAGSSVSSWASGVGQNVQSANMWLYHHNYYVQALVDNSIKAWQALSTGTAAIWKSIHDSIIVPIQGVVAQGLADVHTFIYGTQLLFQFLLGIVSNMLNSMLGTIHSNLTLGAQIFQTAFIAPVQGFFAGFGPWMLQAGQALINMLVQGILSGIGQLGSAVQQVGSVIWKVLGFHSPPAEGPLADSDQYMPNMMRMYAGGILAHVPTLRSAVSSAAGVLLPSGFSSPAMNSAFSSPSSAGSSSGGTFTIQIPIDGKVVAEATMKWVGNQLVLNGVNRTLR